MVQTLLSTDIKLRGSSPPAHQAGTTVNNKKGFIPIEMQSLTTLVLPYTLYENELYRLVLGSFLREVG